jgi:hypothetical protein
MATSFAAVLQQHFDNLGDVLNGGSLYTYEAGTTPNTNPVVLNAYGRATVRLTNGVAYKLVLKDAEGVTLATEDNVIIGEADGDSESQLLVPLTYCGTPGALGFMGGMAVTHTATFPVDFDGSFASVQTNPGSNYVIAIRKNGVQVGMLTFDSAGTPEFTTTGGVTVAIAFGDEITFHGPASIGAAADFLATLVADL